MDELPDLPFERVLSYLSLADRLRSRAVSRRWYHKINVQIKFKVKHLCYSEIPIGRILGKSRWASGSFAENFINSTRFISFFNAYGQTVLSSLKHLHLCDLNRKLENRTAFIRTLNSFSKLEELVIVRVKCNPQRTFKLNLPALTSIHLEELCGIEKLTLDAPRLRKVKLVNSLSYLRLHLVHGESVESFLSNDMRDMRNLRNLKNLRYLYFDFNNYNYNHFYPAIDSTLLSGLEQLKEFHTVDDRNVSELFEQKQRYGRSDLKIYFCGLLLNGPDDPTIYTLLYYSSRYLTEECLVCLAENPSRLADQIPFYRSLSYSAIEFVAPGLEVNLLKRCTDLNKIKVNHPIQNIQRFLDLLKNFENIVDLVFDSDQPQELFDRLPEYCAVQCLTIRRTRPSDLRFLFQLNHLIHLDLGWPADSETVRGAFELLPVLSSFKFRRSYMPAYGYYREVVQIQIVVPERFRVSGVGVKTKTFSEFNSVIQFLFGKAQS